MDTDPEIFVITAAQKGDQQAWGLLFERHFEGVYRYCLVLTQRKQDMAEEITQQVFVATAQQIKQFRPGKASFRTWLLAMAKNIHLKHLSKENIRHKWFLSQLFEKKQFREYPDDSKLFIHEALARLPEKYRLVLEAKYIEQSTVKQIADEQNWTLKATESVLSRAKEKFRQIYRLVQDS